MGNNPKAEEYWKKFINSLPEDAEKPEKHEAWYFCDSEDCANELGELVRTGIKTGTASLVYWYEVEGEVLPQPGDYSVITNWDGDPLCIIQTTSIEICPFNEVSAEHAFAEGEGDRSLAYWREVHWRYFSRECVELGKEPTETMPVVCELFKVVYPA